MNALSCALARLRLQQRAAGLSASEALRLEEHLATCDECRGQAIALDALCALARTHEPVLSPAARERAISAALASVNTAPASVRAPHGVSLRWSFTAAAVLAGVLIALWQRSSDAPSRAAVEPAKASSPGASTQPQRDRVVSGSIVVNGQRRELSATIGSGEELSVASETTLSLAHASVWLAKDSRARWQAGTNELELIAGRVRVEVDPAKHRPFGVKTARFTAQVLGTTFEVDLEGVRVEHGVVRVVGPDGVVLAEGLKAGDRFTFAPAESAEHPSEAEAPTAEGIRQPDGHGDAVRRLLRHARESLAARDATAARGEISAALAMQPSRALRAEAMSLRAECSLVEDDVDGAVRAYLQVARRFDHLPAAQNALFAAARLQAERGRSREAAELFSRYVDRYPTGALVEDARRRLKALSASRSAR